MRDKVCSSCNPVITPVYEGGQSHSRKKLDAPINAEVNKPVYKDMHSPAFNKEAYTTTQINHPKSLQESEVSHCFISPHFKEEPQLLTDGGQGGREQSAGAAGEGCPQTPAQTQGLPGHPVLLLSGPPQLVLLLWAQPLCLRLLLRTRNAQKGRQSRPLRLFAGETQTSQHQETRIPPDAGAGTARSRADRGSTQAEAGLTETTRRAVGEPTQSRGGGGDSEATAAGREGASGLRRAGTDARTAGRRPSGGGDGGRSSSRLGNPTDEGPGGLQGVAKARARLGDFTFLLSIVPSGEGNGNPLQCSRLENPTDRRAWRATVYEVAESHTGLSNTHTHTQETKGSEGILQTVVGGLETRGKPYLQMGKRSLMNQQVDK